MRNFIAVSLDLFPPASRSQGPSKQHRRTPHSRPFDTEVHTKIPSCDNTKPECNNEGQAISVTLAPDDRSSKAGRFGARPKDAAETENTNEILSDCLRASGTPFLQRCHRAGNTGANPEPEPDVAAWPRNGFDGFPDHSSRRHRTRIPRNQSSSHRRNGHNRDAGQHHLMFDGGDLTIDDVRIDLHLRRRRIGCWRCNAGHRRTVWNVDIGDLQLRLGKRRSIVGCNANIAHNDGRCRSNRRSVGIHGDRQSRSQLCSTSADNRSLPHHG